MLLLVLLPLLLLLLLLAAELFADPAADMLKFNLLSSPAFTIVFKGF